MSDRIEIVEVGPRDGLQNEPTPIPTEQKAAFIAALAAAGLQEIEATSFVSPKWVPQLGDAAELWPLLPKGPKYSALVPNAKGLERAIACGVDRIAVFTAASESFVKRNINMSRQESLDTFGAIIEQFRAARPDGFVRGYVSTVVGCPYEGAIDPDDVIGTANSLLAMGVDEVSLGDTIGVAVPADLKPLFALLYHIPHHQVAWHFHDTRGTALANVEAAIEAGFRRFDSSAAGLGGWASPPRAGGNLATEDLVYFAERSGLATGVNLAALAEASRPILQALAMAPRSKVQQVALAETPAS